jgi:hypothetical protein
VTDRQPDGGDPEEVPEDLIAKAKAAFASGVGKSELAPLLYDSLVEGRDPASDHVLRFQHSRLVVEVHVYAWPEDVRLSGTVRPEGADRVLLQLDTSEVRFVAPLEEGEFAFELVGHGLVRLHVIGADAADDVHTDWFHI